MPEIEKYDYLPKPYKVNIILLRQRLNSLQIIEYYSSTCFDENLPIFSFQDKPLIKFKSHLYFEEKDRLQENLKNLKPLPGSKITYFKNGEPLGEAFTDIYMVSSILW